MRLRRGSIVAVATFKVQSLMPFGRLKFKVQKVQRTIVATANIIIFSDTHSTFLAFLRVFFKSIDVRIKTVRMRTVCEWTRKPNDN